MTLYRTTDSKNAGKKSGQTAAYTKDEAGLDLA